MPFQSPLPDVVTPETSVPAFVLEHAAEHGARAALIEGPTGRTITYAKLDMAVKRVAAGLAARGLAKGDALAILAPNVPEWPIAFLGATLAGGMVTGINPAFTAAEVAFQLRDTAARYLVTVPALLDRALPAAADAGVDEVFVAGGGDQRATPFSALFGHGDEPPGVRIDPATDVVALPYSSGTTGLPKGVMQSHRGMVANIGQLGAAIFQPFPGETFLPLVPYFGAGGMTAMIGTTLRNGATVITMPGFDLEQTLRLVQDHRVTRLVGAPPLVLALAKHPLVDRYDLSGVREVRSAGAPLDGAIAEACARRLGCPVLQLMGMTEATAGVAGVPEGTAGSTGSVGVLLPGTEGRIVDPTTGMDLGPGDTGELWIRGPQLMLGYRNKPEATAAAIDADGWLHTGDLAKLDGNGELWIVDRLKEVIKVRGLQVAPAQLEGILCCHPAVADAAVVRMSDPEDGEAPKAFVVVSGAVTAEELMAYVAERVAPHKRIRAVAFVDAIPKNPTGKILRRLLVDQPSTAGSSAREAIPSLR